MASALLGAGYAGAGTAAAGFGTPAVADSPPALAAAAEALAIDPITKDYERDADGNIAGMTSAQQRVYLALATLRGSAVDRSLGIAQAPDRVNDNTLLTLEDDVRRALAPMVRDKSIAITEVTVVRNGASRIARRVRWVDLTTGSAEVTNG